MNLIRTELYRTFESPNAFELITKSVSGSTLSVETTNAVESLAPNTLKRIRCRFPVFPYSVICATRSRCWFPGEMAIQAMMSFARIRNSLEIFLSKGISGREAFDADCVHRHPALRTP